MKSAVAELSEYFRDAPYFRVHGGIIGGAYRLKERPLGAGLWFPKEPMKMEVVRRKPWNGSWRGGLFRAAESREAALREYDVSIMDVQPGDAVIDDFLPLKASRRSIYDILEEPIEDHYRFLREIGALISFHIPGDEFRDNYIYDDVKRCYWTVPYRIKFAEEDAFVQTDGDGVEHVTKFSTAKLRKGQLSILSLPVFSGVDERLICGQSLQFYMKEAADYLKIEGAIFFETLGVSTGLSFTVLESMGRRRMENPYLSMRRLFEVAANLFDQAQILSVEQRGEFEAHRRDIGARYAYFEAQPLV